MCLSGWNAVNNLEEFIDICAYSRLQLKLLSATSTKQEDVISISFNEHKDYVTLLSNYVCAFGCNENK